MLAASPMLSNVNTAGAELGVADGNGEGRFYLLVQVIPKKKFLKK
jgi:hypothetical protein